MPGLKEVEEIISHPATVSGAAGGLLFALKFMPGATLLEKAFHVVCAAGIGYFAGPALAELFNINSFRMAMGLAALLGVVGVTAIGILLETLRAWGQQAKDYPIMDKFFGWLPWGKK